MFGDPRAVGRNRTGKALTSPAARVGALCLALALATVYVEYRALPALVPRPVTARYVVEHDFLRIHLGVLHHTIGDPWRFRLLSEWAAEGFRKAADALGFSHPAVAGFLTFRVLQNALIFALAWLYYRRLGASRLAAALGLGLTAWAFTQSLLHAYLAFNTYGDIAFYLAAALLILDRRYALIVPLTILAAVNRETSGLIPLMLLAEGIRQGRTTQTGKRALTYGAAALAAFAATYGAVRLAVGPGSYFIYGNGHHPGFDMLGYNVGRGETWDTLFRTVTFVPLLALAAFRSWPPALKAFGIALAPAWLVIHFFTGVIAESRLVLVPFVLVAVPGLLAGLASAPAGSGGWRGTPRPGRTRP